MKSLTFRIFTSTFFVGVLTYAFCAGIFVSNMYSYFEKQLFEELRNESHLIESILKSDEKNPLENITTKNRITLIHPDGEVYFDNTVDAKSLENHASREEFIKAVENGEVNISRYSSTMTAKSLYFAKILKNGDVLRISCTQRSVAVIVFAMSQTLLIMLVFAMIISGIVANYLSKKITDPLNRIDLENPEKTNVYEELTPFTKRIAEENFEREEREELRQQFTANVSHELKTPLTSISGFAEILKNGNTDEKTTKDFASTIYDESQRMITLVNDIIKLSKLDEKSISLEKEALSLREVTLEVLEALRPSSLKKNISLNLSGESGLINGVHQVIFEMIYNIVDNAIKYNVENGSVNIQIKNMIESNRVILTVKDSGIGIPENERLRVFERFYRVDKSRSKELGGTGLGLSIVKHGAKYHNATVLLSSELGKGTTVTLIFTI